MELSPQDVRDVRFGTTRVRAGYNMAEVDAFLDVIEGAIETYSVESRQLRDEADALRSQIQQVQSRLSAVQAELDECRAQPAGVDTETTAENPVIASTSVAQWDALRKVRDDVHHMLREQLDLVEKLRIETDYETD